MCFVNTWEAEHAARVGAAVKELRGKRPAQWLADRTDELGLKMTRQTITDLENGRRRYVTTAELVVLAKALDTAAIMLLYPPPYSEEVEAAPGDVKRKIDAVQEFSGFIDEPGAAMLRSRDNLESGIEVLDGTDLADDQRESLRRTRQRLEQLKADDGW